MTGEEQDRHSKAPEAELIADPIARARAEARNGLRQFDAVIELIEYFLSPDRKVRLRPSHLLHLHRIALEGISSYAGVWRPAGIEIGGGFCGIPPLRTKRARMGQPLELLRLLFSVSLPRRLRRTGRPFLD